MFEGHRMAQTGFIKEADWNRFVQKCESIVIKSFVNGEVSITPGGTMLKIPDFGAAISKLKRQVQVVQQTVSTVQDDVSTLQDTIQTIQSDINTLKSQMTTAQSDITSLKSRADALETLTNGLSQIPVGTANTVLGKT